MEEPKAKMDCPEKINKVKHKSIRRGPKRSTKTPPKKGNTMFGIA
jgi:hypothetical protein